MKIKFLIFNLFAFILVSCGVSKAKPTEAQLATLNQLVNEKQFKIESDWAYPQATMAMQQVLNSGILPPGDTAGNINLIGNRNFLTIEGDSVSSYLPYFGERQMLVDYGGMDSAIELKGLMEDYKIEKNKNYGYNISFKAQSGQEQFSVFISINPDLKTNMVLNGSGRFPIRYSGLATPISADSDEDEGS